MKASKRMCERCEFFQTRQGKGTGGDCKLVPVSVKKEPTNWCGQFSINREKYHVDGKKIYTRINTNRMTPDEG
jgi:hypothetical protein